MVIIDDRGVRSQSMSEPQKIDKNFVSLNIFILRAPIVKSMDNLYMNTRLNIGRELYNETKYDADIVLYLF